MTNNKLFKIRIKHLKAVATLLQLTPFLRCILLNGSLAEGKIEQTSDIDLLLIAKDGRIFSTRFFASILTWLTGLKRSSDEKKDHSGKFCLNYFLTVSFLTVPTGRGEKVDQYCAHNYSKSLMVWGKRDIFFNFMEINRENWSKYLTNQKSYLKSKNDRSKIKSKIPIRTWHFGVRMRDFMEKMLGDRVEQMLKKIQLRKINRDPRTIKYPDYIVINDKELRFHSPK